MKIICEVCERDISDEQEYICDKCERIVCTECCSGGFHVVCVECE